MIVCIDSSSAYVSHDPIVINSNYDFINQGWPGSGTESDPWIIEGLEIDGLNEWKCIDINNVEGHFEIRDCYLYHSESVYTTIGISLEYVTKCLIFDNEIANNDGEGIPVEIHETENIWIPTLIFGHLLTSSNYDDTEDRITGGRNGFGAKLTNIYSSKFTVETCDKKIGKKFIQQWSDNMSKANKPKITTFQNGKDGNRI